MLKYLNNRKGWHRVHLMGPQNSIFGFMLLILHILVVTLIIDNVSFRSKHHGLTDITLQSPAVPLHL